MADIGGGAVVGAFVSEGLKLLIAEVKTVLAFKPVSKELASTMEDLVPIVKEIESLQSDDELKNLKVTIAKAEVLVKKCSRVKRWEVFDKAKYTKKVWKIQKEMVSFCQVQLQLLQHRNQLQSTENIKKLDIMMKYIDDNLEIINNKLDLLREEMNNNHQDVMKKLEIATEKIDLLLGPINRDICPVPNLGKAPIEIDWPQMQPKKKVLDDSVDSLLVSGSSGCEKTKLVNQMPPKKKVLDDSVDSLLVSGFPGCGKTKLVSQMQPKKKVLDDFVVCPEEVKKEGKTMTDGVNLGLGSVGGALVSELRMAVITEAKKFKAFKPFSNNLVSTMEMILLITETIDELGLGVEELKGLKDTIESARVMVDKFPGVRFYEKAKYKRKIEKINKDLLKFCQIDLQLLRHRNKLTLLGLTDNLE